MITVEARATTGQIKEHLLYLKEVSTKGNPPLISAGIASAARRAWEILFEATGYALPIPAACTGPDGKLLYSWDKGRHHLELELIPGQPAEFFYRDRQTGDLWGEDYDLTQALSADAIQKLKLLAGS